MNAQAATAAFPWVQVATTVIGSGFLAASVTAIISGFAANRERHRQGRDTALRAASMLEEFARSAAETAASAKHYDRHEEYGPSLVPIPAAPEIGDLDWKVVPEGLAARAFGFKQIAVIANSYIKAVFDEDDDEGLAAYLNQALRLGLIAWQIAVDLRREYRLPPPEILIGQYNFATWMRDEQEQINSRIAEAQRKRAKI